MRLPGGVPVNYCSWASHRLPDVWPEPDAFRPERFAPGNRERIPKGAYVPFGGGSRTCIGMRFGLAEIGVIAAAILERFRLELAPGYRLVTRQSPTIGPERRDADGRRARPRAGPWQSPPWPRSSRYLPTCDGQHARAVALGAEVAQPTGRRSGCCPSRTRQLVV